MIRNYNVLGGCRDTILKNQSELEVDKCSASITSKKEKSSTYVGWLVTFLLMFGLSVNAQVASYGFAEAAGTYTPLVGGTVVATATGASGAASLDDINYTLPNGTIPFTFTFDNVGYTGLTISTNGHISFGTSSGTTYTPISATHASSGIISACGGDLNSLFNINGNTGEIRYETVGSEFVIQYSNFRPFNTSTSTTLYWRWNFQIRLHSDGTIRIVYDTSFLGAVTSSTRQVGLRGPNNTFATNVKNRLITNGTHTWDTSVAGTANSSTCGFSTTNLPTSGKTFIFSPPGPCSGTPTAGSIPATINAAGLCFGSNSVLTVTGQTTGVSGITYAWEESDDNGVGDPWSAVTNGTGANSATYTAVLTGNKFYRCMVGCSSVGGGSAPTNSCSVTGALINCTYNVVYTTGAMTSIMPANGGSGLAYSGAWSATFNGDDLRTATQLLTGTTFKYQGTAITGFQACTNGWMTFNTSNTSTAFTNGLSLTSPIRALAPFWEDLVMTGNAYANRDICMRYEVQGTLGSGTAVIVIEWAGMERFTIPGPNLNFQVRLYEAGDVIEYVYGKFEGFDGTVTSGYSYSIGYNGATPAGTTASDRFGMQTAVTNHFAASDPANHVVMPACNTKFVFTPGVYSGPTSAPTIPAPSNDNSGTAQSVTVNAAPCSLYCDTYYTSRSATNSGAGQSCATAAGNEDDDVWFTFNTSAANDYLIRLRSSPNYDGVLELYDSTLTLITCVNATTGGLIETINATDLISDGELYYIRVFHNGVGIGTSSGQFSLCVSEVIAPPANDNIGGAITITHTATCSPTNSLLPATLVATASPQTVCGGLADDDVWYKFAFVTTEAIITVQSNSGYNAHVQAFTSSDDTATGVLTSLACVNATGTAGTEVITINGGSPGQIIFVRVYHTLSGPGSGSFSICVTYPPAPVCVANPSAPLNAATVNACLPVTLSWAAVANATAYDVYLDAGAGPATTLVSGDQTGTTYAAGILLQGTSYSWRAVPKNGTGSATGCSDFTFTTSSVPAPICITAPINPVNGGAVCPGSSVVFSWPSLGAGTTYAVTIDAVLVAAAQTGTTFTQTMSAGSHTWSVIPTNCTGTATGCADFTFSTNGPAPACIAAPTYPVNGGSVCPDTSIVFSWPSSGVGVTYAVTIDAVLVAAAQTGTTFTQVMGAGSHTWSVVPSNCFGTATGCVDFTFSTTPVAATCIAAPIYPVNGGSVCPNSSVVFSWPSSGPGVTYAVTIDAVLVAAAQTGTTFTQVMSAGPHTWSVIPTNCFGTPTGCVDFTFNGNATAPLGDTFATAIDLGAISGSSSVNGQILISECWNNDNTGSAGRDAYYKVNLTCAGTIDLSTCTSSFDTLIYLLDSTGTFIDSDDDSCVVGNGLGSLLTVPALPAGIYYVVVDGFGATSQGTYTLNITTTPTVQCSSTVNLKLYIEGFYDAGSMRSVKFNQDGSSPLDEVEDITVELHDATTYALVVSTTATLKTNGTAVCTFNTAPSGSFYIAVKNSNAVQTWSAAPQSVGAIPLTYDFSTAANKAYGDNQIDLGGMVYGFYSGDINQDDVIDGSDATDLDLDIFNSEFGVRDTDLNGDGTVDGSDSIFYENNSFNSVFASFPQ